MNRIPHPDVLRPPGLQQLFDLQHKASRGLDAPDWAQREDRLKRLRDLVRENRAAFAREISADFGQRSVHETEMMEIHHVLDGIAHALRHGRQWMRRKTRRTGAKFWPGRSYVVPQPLGVAGIVAPWNYPLDLAAGPATAALAAGNRVMVKMSEHSPRFGACFAQAVERWFRPEELVVVNGDADLGRRFCALPFDHLLFTGSTAVAHHVMRAASDHLTPLTLELGGKSPALFGANIDFDDAVLRTVLGKCLNAGQTCIAPDYVLLPRGSEGRFVESARRAVARLYPQLASTPDYTSIASPQHFARLRGLLDDALDAGATAHPLADVANDPERRRFVPTVLTDVPPQARVLREEIFGPLLPLVGYDSLDEAIGFVNQRPRALALYAFERDARNLERIVARTVTGGVTLNDTLLHAGQDDLPFGGIGPSGMGAYHGEVGFRTFSHDKAVFAQSRLNFVRLLYPPFGRRAESLLGMPKT